MAYGIDIFLARIRQRDLDAARRHGCVFEGDEWYVLLNSSERPITGHMYGNMQVDQIRNIDFYNQSRYSKWIYKVCVNGDGLDTLESNDDFYVNTSGYYYNVNRDRSKRSW